MLFSKYNNQGQLKKRNHACKNHRIFVVVFKTHFTTLRIKPRTLVYAELCMLSKSSITQLHPKPGHTVYRLCSNFLSQQHQHCLSLESMHPQHAGMKSMCLQHFGMKSMHPQHAGMKSRHPQHAGMENMHPQHAGLESMYPPHDEIENMYSQHVGLESMHPAHAGVDKVIS